MFLELIAIEKLPEGFKKRLLAKGYDPESKKYTGKTRRRLNRVLPIHKLQEEIQQAAAETS